MAMNNKTVTSILICFTISSLIYVGGKLNFHHTIVKAALAPHCTKILAFANLTSTTGAPFLGKNKAVARKLVDIYQELSAGKAASPKLLLQLKGLIGELDPAYKLSQDSEPTEPDNVNTSVVLDVCPEKYMGEKYGYPFYHKGWEMQKCSNTKPLEKVVSIVVNTIAYPEASEKQVHTVLRGINQTYPQLQVFLAAKTTHIEQAANKYPNVKTIMVTKGSSLGKTWNQLIDKVSTPYTLVARDVVHFTWVARIERQIRMISTTEHAGIAGGSFRNLTGHWRVGCRQTKLFNYVLIYEEGYHYSRHSCMFCDDLQGPFVARTDLLKNFKFNEKYSKEIIFEDFFLRVSRAGNLILNCPDSMYFTTDYSTETKHNNKAIWQALATDLKLVRVVLVDYGVKHKFTCEEISYSCDVSVTKEVALPMCCLEQFSTAMKLFHDICIKHGLHYELDTGSILASVKFNNYSPYDIDGDVIMLSHDITTFHTFDSLISQHGYHISDYKPDTFLKYHTQNINTEVWSIKSMTNDLYSPVELRTPTSYTKSQVNNHWLNTAHCPALYSRNRYGPDVLKHSQSWRHVGTANSFARYQPGKFVACSDPLFHSCLNHFPGDGNIAFKVL